MRARALRLLGALLTGPIGFLVSGVIDVVFALLLGARWWLRRGRRCGPRTADR